MLTPGLQSFATHAHAVREPCCLLTRASVHLDLPGDFLKDALHSTHRAPPKKGRAPALPRRIAARSRILEGGTMESGTTGTKSMFASPWTQLVIGIICMASVANL